MEKEYKIIRTAWLPDGYVIAKSEEEAIEKAVNDWGIKRETIVGAIIVQR